MIMKKSAVRLLRHLPKILCIVIAFLGLIFYPREIGNGVRNGLTLLGEKVIPSLFPFMILSTYISFSPYSFHISRLLHKPARKIFNINGAGLTAVFLGILGGYPIGAKAVSDFYQLKRLDKSDINRLLCWCVNPSPAFVITATGTFMMSNTQSGIVMYISLMLASLTIGIFARFIPSESYGHEAIPNAFPIDRKNIFINSVSSGSKAMLSICGWVLLFSAVCAGLDCLTESKEITLLIKVFSEVTTGCESGIANGLSLPLICAILGFGGFAVIFQVAPYLEKCDYNLKFFICWRLINGALSAFYCSRIMKLFPDSQAVFQTVTVGSSEFTLSHSIGASVILLLTCIVLILEVDNKRKMC